MKKNLLCVLLTSMILALTACSTGTSEPENKGTTPELKTAFIISQSEEVIKSFINWGDLKKYEIFELTNKSVYSYRLYINYIDPDLDVCELQVGWSEDKFETYKKFNNQDYINEYRYIDYSVTHSNIFDGKRTLYLRVLDSKGNISNVVKIENLSIKCINDNKAPELLKAYFIPFTKNIDWTKVEESKVTTFQKDKDYMLIIDFSDDDIDVTKLLFGSDVNNLDGSKDFTQNYKGELHSFSSFVFTESDLSKNSYSFYTQLKDSKNNLSNIIEIKIK